MFEISQLPDLALTLIVYLVLGLCVIAVLVSIAWFRHVPYRVVMKNQEWRLEHREHLFDDWLEVANSASKSEIQKLAREALFAHYKFKEFVSGVDIEVIRDAKVISDK
ncbi:hypothetical protein RRK67_004060 [Vibrio fluvialis]|nr:hypothetical protein [Vibrio fluvialis]